MQNNATNSNYVRDIKAHLEKASALELVRRSILGTSAFAVMSLVMTVRTPLFMNYGMWTIFAGIILILLAAMRVSFAIGFKQRYKRDGEKAVFLFNILTILQSVILGVLAAIIIFQYWAVSEVALTLVISALCVAAGTSAVSVRRSAHMIFLICVLGPFGVAVFMVGGLGKSLLILGFLILMTFLVQDSTQVRRAYIQQLRNQFDDQMKLKQSVAEYLDERETSAEMMDENSGLSQTFSIETENKAKASTIEVPRGLSKDYPHEILVVDDDETHRELMSIHFSKLGYQIDVAEDGQQAVASVMKNNYDLLFMDIKMPFMSGIDSTSWIREHFDNEKPLRIIALTGDSTEETRARCKQAGMDDFVVKPVNNEILEAILKNRPSITEN